MFVRYEMHDRLAHHVDREARAASPDNAGLTKFSHWLQLMTKADLPPKIMKSATPIGHGVAYSIVRAGEGFNHFFPRPRVPRVPVFFVVFFFPRFFVVFFDVFFDGTFPPARRASDRPIAIACFLLVTFFPEPLRSVPFFRFFIARSTFFDAFLPYFAM